MIGKNIGSYKVNSLIGEGGMGQVYTAEHSLIGRNAAIKVLLPQFSHRQDIVNRFFNEAKAATAINHPGIVEIYDFGYHTDGSAFIVMELLSGESLEARLRRSGSLALASALDIIAQMANALAAAHAQGIVHRDLKPENVFLVPDPVSGSERTKILDFGIAKLAPTDGAGSQTGTGVVMGTPSYMAPEQCRGAGKVDSRADLYSLGCMLFELLCGRPPFDGEGAGEVLAAHIHVAPPRALSLAPTLPADVDAVIARLLAKDPAHRHQSAGELVDELRTILAGLAGMYDRQAVTRPASVPPGTLIAPGSVPPGSQQPAPGSYPPAVSPGSYPPSPQQPTPGSYPPAVSPGSQPPPVSSGARPATGPQGTMKLGTGSYPPSGAPAIPTGHPPTMHLGTDAGRPAAESRVTTLGAAAGALSSAPAVKSGGGAGKFAAVFVTLAAVGGGVFLFTRGGASGDQTTASSSPVAASPTADTRTSAPTAPLEPAAVKAQPAQPAVTSPKAKMITVSLKSNPAGAIIYREPDGVRLGITPREITRAATEGELEFVLVLPGHKRQKVLVPADKTSSRVVELAREKRSRPKRPRSKKPRPKKPDSSGGIEDRTVDPFSK